MRRSSDLPLSGVWLGRRVPVDSHRHGSMVDCAEWSSAASGILAASSDQEEKRIAAFSNTKWRPAGVSDINDPSNKQKQTLCSKCAKLSDAKCFESIAQCCCFHKPKKG